MSATSSKPNDFTTANFQEMFEYIRDQQQFTNLLSDLTKDFFLVDYPKNKKENIIGYWLAIKLRIIVDALFKNMTNKPPIRIMAQERVSGLLEKSNTYNLVIYINEVPAIVVDVNFITNNLSTNFPRIFKNIVYNANNINQYEGMEYISLFVVAEKTPSFTANKQYDKDEEMSLFNLIKLTNLSLCKHNRFDISTIVLTPFIDGTTGKPKIKKPNLSNYNIFHTQCLRENISLDIFHNIEDTVLNNDIMKFLQKILNKIQYRMFGRAES